MPKQKQAEAEIELAPAALSREAAGVPPESQSNSRLEVGHVLFLDIVGYSKLLIEEQKERLRQPTRSHSQELREQGFTG